MKTILYDLGDIFFDAHAWRAWLHRVLRRRGAYEGSFREYYEEYEAWLLPVYRGESEYGEAFLSWLDRHAALDLHTRAMARKEQIERGRHLYPGVRGTLRRLADQGIANIVLSDCESRAETVMADLASRFRLAGCVHGVVTSRDVGYTKPSPEMFRAGLARSGARSDEAMFVGHDRDEIEGARAVGITVVEFNNYLGYQTNADLRIRRFSQLLHCVGRV